MDFKGKIALVTGASRGIGKIMALEFGRQGASVVLVARSIAELEEVEDAIIGEGGNAMAVTADISNPSSVQELGAQVGMAYGHVDILVNNAAIAILKPLVQQKPEEWQAMMGVNLQGMFHMTNIFLPGMIERRSGVIINMSAAVGRNGYPNLAVYSATKAAVIAFSEALAKELRRYAVQVYAISPHGVNTGLYHSLFGNADADKLLQPEMVVQDVLKVARGESGLRSGQTLDIALHA